MCFCISYGLCVYYVADAVLISTPFYGVITEDLQLYSDVKLFHVPLDCEVRKESRIYLDCLLCVGVQHVCSICCYCCYITIQIKYTVSHMYNIGIALKNIMGSCAVSCIVSFPIECFCVVFFYFQSDGKDSRPFQLTVSKLEEGLERAKQEVSHDCICFEPLTPNEYVKKHQTTQTMLCIQKRTLDTLCFLSDLLCL